MARPRKAAPKKSTAKSATRKRTTTAKKQDTMANVSADISRLKDQLLQSGEKLVDGISKRVQAVKTKLDKAISKQKSAKDRRVAANKRMKKKASATAEQAVEKAKVAYESALKDAEALRKEYDAGKAQLRTLKEENAKAAALAKTIDSFEKKWEAKMAKVRKKSGPKRPRGRPRKSATKSAS